jgi:hypothetical protein
LLFPIFEPPENYDGHLKISHPNNFVIDYWMYGYYYSRAYIQDIKTENYLLESLSFEDENLIREIFDINRFDSNKYTYSEYIEIAKFNKLLNSTDEFITHCEKFNNSELKPNYDLIRVLVIDNKDNCQKRQRYYTELLEGKLDFFISNGDVIENNNIYRLKKNINLKSVSKNEGIYGYLVEMFPTIGKNMADYIHKQGNELIKIQFNQQISDIILDSIYRDELPIYRMPTLQMISFYNEIDLKDCLILWHDIKIILEEKTRQKIFDNPVFQEEFKNDIEQPSNDNTVNILSIYKLRDDDFDMWIKETSLNHESMTKDGIHKELIKRNSQLWTSGFVDWWKRQTIYRGKPGRKKKTIE